MGFKSAGNSGGGGFKSAGGGSAPKHSSLIAKVLGAPTGLVTHAATDLKDAVVGLPTGIVQLVKHPVQSAELMGKATWHDWSPLFQGHPLKFAEQTYAHPLAPILDVATVFSAGAGAAGKLAKIAEAGGMEGRLIKGAADLAKPSMRVLRNQTGKESVTYTKTYGASAGANLRRQLANRAMLHLEPHLPDWFQTANREQRMWERHHVVDLAHRGAATNVAITAALKAGRALEDPTLAHIVQPEILAHNYWQFRRYAHQWDIRKPIPAGFMPIREITAANKDSIFAVKHDLQGNVIPLTSRMRDFATKDEFQANGLKDAAKVEGGKKVLIVPRHSINLQAQEGARSAKFLTKLFHNPVMIWKRIQVGYAPRVVMNNGVGNWLMYAMRTAGNGGGRGFVEAIRHTHGERAAMSAFKEMRDHITETEGAAAGAKFTVMAHPALTADPNLVGIEKAFGKHAADAMTRDPNWVRKHFATEIGNTFGQVLEDRSRSRLGHVARSGFYPLVHRLADQPVRIASLYHFMHSAPEVKSFMKTHPGTTLNEGIDRVLSGKGGAAIRQRAEQHVRSIAGDYTSMHPAEQLVQNLMPFYLWDKHIAKHFVNMVSEKPGRIALMQETSRMGNKEAEKLLGKLPGFMQGALPLSLFGLQGHNGRTPLLMTRGLNPYSTAGDLAQLASSLTTDPNATRAAEAAGNLSPFLSGLIEQFSGHRLGTQAPVARHGGILPSVVGQTAQNMTYGTILQRLFQGTPQPKPNAQGKTKPFLYEKTLGEAASGLFGLPVKEASLERAHQMFDQENGIKKKKKGGGFTSAGG